MAPDDALALSEEFAALGGAMEHLGEKQREALVLRGVLELPIPEVARRIGRSPNAAKMLVHRARERVRNELAAA